MPTVVCGLDAFKAPPGHCQTAGDAEAVFMDSLGPAMQKITCVVEVFRLERLEPDEPLDEHDVVLCRIPEWQFDLASLEALHEEVEQLIEQQQDLQVNLARAKEALCEMVLAARPVEAEGPSLAPAEREQRRRWQRRRRPWSTPLPMGVVEEEFESERPFMPLARIFRRSQAREVNGCWPDQGQPQVNPSAATGPTTRSPGREAQCRSTKSSGQCLDWFWCSSADRVPDASAPARSFHGMSPFTEQPVSSLAPFSTEPRGAACAPLRPSRRQFKV